MATRLENSEAAYGRDALTRRLAAEFFDPARQGVIARMSVLDNALADTSARDKASRVAKSSSTTKTSPREVAFHGIVQTSAIDFLMTEPAVHAV